LQGGGAHPDRKREEQAMTTTPVRWLGIDVSKHQLDLLSFPDRTQWQVPNDAAGWTQLCTELAAQPPTLIVLEATGRYEVGVVVALDAAGMTPVVMNPLAIRRFAQSLGRRAKNDRLDAELLARYAEQMRPVPRPIPAQTARDLRELLARRQQLTEELVMEKNRLHQATALVRPSILRLLAVLEDELAGMDALLAAVVAGDPAWQQRVEQLDTVPGIAPLSATRLAVGLPELGQLTGRELAALAGVAPFTRESGRFRGARQIAGGRAPVRQTLYQVLITTIRCDPVFRAHYAQLRERGKPHKVALVACMRRLLGILNAMVREGLTWPQTAVGQGRFLPVAA
jgi:transposase